MIVYIDFASSGDAGFYSNQWSKAFKKSGCKYLGLINVDSHIKSPRFKKVVLSAQFSQSKLCLALVLFSHVLTLFAVLAAGLFLRPRIIYNLHQPFTYWKLFNMACKFIGLKVYPVVHDIVAFDTQSYPVQIISSNEAILKHVSAAVVHQGHERFGQLYPDLGYTFLPFPIRDKFEEQASLVEGPYLYLPGKYRKEKGFDFVISNWPEDFQYKLVVSSPVPEHLEKVVLENVNIEYQPDKTAFAAFQAMISNCSGALLMYTEGTNSGILETLVANNKPCLVSNINIFQTHEVAGQLIFSNLDPVSFQKSLNEFVEVAERATSFQYNERQENLAHYIHFINNNACSRA